MTDQALYGDRAELYDLIYHGKDYAAEAESLRTLLAEHGVADVASVLEAACGTGSHLAELHRWYRVSGFDLSEAVLDIARTKVPDVPLFVADMCDFEIEEPADAVLCLFSSIGYAVGEDRLSDAARAFARALRPGGVLVVEPWLTPEQYRTGFPNLQTYESDDLKLCRANVSRREGDLSILDFHWLVVPAGGEVEHVTERHVLQLYTREQMLAALEGAGFDVGYREEGLMPGRGLYVGRMA
ncbi:MAG: class I SAM-dependent DNA methyltransferase [Planctomycetota bacterium]